MCAFSQKLRANLNVLPISIYWRECDHILSHIILSYVMLSEGGSAECDTMIIYRSLSSRAQARTHFATSHLLHQHALS